MQFVVPKFIEHEAKIAGPLTFRQLIYLGVAGGISFFLYFVLALPLLPSIIVAIFLFGIASALAFLKIEGRSLPVILKDFLFFFASPKLYLWYKKELPTRFIKKEKGKKEKENSKLTISGGKLNQLSTQLETKTK